MRKPSREHMAASRSGRGAGAWLGVVLPVFVVLVLIVPAVPALGSHPVNSSAAHEAKTVARVTSTPEAPAASSSVAYTLDLCTNHLYSGNAFPTDCSGDQPLGVAYDSGKGEVFVTDSNCPSYPPCGQGNVSVISDGTNKVVATIPVGSWPGGVAYDSGKGEVFVANFGSNNVSVISDASIRVVATIPVGIDPSGVAYDSGKGEVFVTSEYNSVSVISDATNKVVATIPVEGGPDGVAYDSGKGEVFVTNGNYNTVSVISGTSNSVVATIPVGSYPWSVAYDSGKGEVFVANQVSNNVSVISDATNKVVTTIGVGTEPDGVAYDSGKGEVFVINSICMTSVCGPGSVSVISDINDTATSTVTVGTAPTFAASDLSNGYVYVSNEFQGTISIITTNPAAPSTPNPTTGFLGLPGDDGYILIGVVAIILLTIAITVHVRRKRALPPAPVSTPQTNLPGKLPQPPPGHTWLLTGARRNMKKVDQESVRTSESSWPSYQRAHPRERVRINTTNRISHFKMPTARFALGGQSLRSTFVIALVVPLITSPFFGILPLPHDLPNSSSGASGGSVIGAVVATIPVGIGPEALSYDSVDDSIFVANSAGSLSVIDGSTLQVKATTPLPAIPIDMTYDNNSNELYVVGAQGIVSIIDGSSAKVIGTLTVPITNFSSQNDLVGVAYDFRNKNLYITAISTTVTLINTYSNKIIGHVQTNNTLSRIRYDAMNGLLYALTDCGGILVINSTTNSVSTYLSQPPMACAQDVTFDPEGGEVFISNQLLGDVWVLNGTTNQLVRSIPVNGYPVAAAFDPLNDRLYIATFSSVFGPAEVGNVTVVNVASGETIGSIQVGINPSSIVFDSKTGLFYVSDANSQEVSVISPNATDSSGGPTNGLLGLPGVEGYVIMGVLIAAIVLVVVLVWTRSLRYKNP